MMPALCGFERARHLYANLKRLGYAHSAPPDSLTERLPLDELGRDDVPAVKLADLMNGDDVRVAQGGSRACLLLETLQAGLTAGKTGWQYLQGYLPAQAVVFSQVHFPHAAAAKQAEDFVVADLLAFG